MNCLLKIYKFSHFSRDECRNSFRSTNDKNEDVSEKEYAAVSQQPKLPGVNWLWIGIENIHMATHIFGDVSTPAEGIPKN